LKLDVDAGGGDFRAATAPLVSNAHRREKLHRWSSERPSRASIPQTMGKWIGLLIVAIVGLAVLGFLVDAARAIAGVLLVVCLIVLGVRVIAKRNS
jgi:hypothetical protein